MRIIAFMNSYVGGISGGDVRFIEIAKRMQERELEIWVITSKQGKRVCEEYGLKAKYMLTTYEEKMEVKDVVYEVKDIVYTYFKRMIKTLLLKLKLRKGDILYSTSDFLPDVLPAFIWKLRNKNLKWVVSVYHLIPSPFQRPGGFKLHNVLSYIGQQVSWLIIRRWADLIQTETLFLKRKLIEELRIPSEKIVAVQSGIDTKIIDKVSSNEEKIYDACFLARLHPSKGIFDLIKAWERVCKRKKDAKLVIAGSGSTRIFNELKDEVKSLSLERNVAIIGFLSEEEKYKLFKSSKLYVLPSYEEGIPITFYEAMYCGLPVITYYLPTYEEIKDYIVSVPLGDVKKLAEEIVRLLENEDLVRKLGNKGREFVKENTWDKVADYIISRIEYLVYEKD